MKNEELIEKLLDSICRSDAHIDQTNTLIQKLTDLYEKQEDSKRRLYETLDKVLDITNNLSLNQSQTHINITQQ